MTKEEAVRVYESKWWEGLPDDAIFAVQIDESRLITPWEVFHKAAESALRRPVFTHEFANYLSLKNEFLGLVKAPSLEQIIGMIPAEKRLLVVLGKEGLDE